MIVSGRYPEGIAAHSRWLSAAIPPVQQHHSDPIPEGLQPLESLAQSYGWNPSGIQERCWNLKPVVSLRSTTGYWLRPLRGGTMDFLV